MGFDVIRQWMQKIVNFQEGKPYTEHVPFERLFPLRDVALCTWSQDCQQLRKVPL